ncbi:Pyridoxal 4-dehydrogenase [Rubripirellula lacrimiformis]|uniref:Pyridoxal 4-dehydrogenase n=1 Tax=Rubripirellula lacrimiformis TaxID=1930273 RepID=A0A517NC67_9BACT|nr:aldo/keto reductase [Rubripirellula lacrimiformis]QDT04618.1 Pyridoxal 4-dehydrogenase [Rubripirellula lacrimiformis]
MNLNPSASHPAATPIGQTGVSLPPIVFGNSSLGNIYRVIDDDVKRQIVAEWFAQSPGIPAVDSAGKYGAGLSLEVTAKALAGLGVASESIVICNKLGWRRVPLQTPEPTFENGIWFDLEYDAVQDISYDGIGRCFDQGCELLSPYRPQMVSVHDPDEYLDAAIDDADRTARWDDILGGYRRLRELRDSGQVAAIGVGAKDWRASKRLADQCELDWVMLATSLTVYRHDRELLEFVESLHQRGIAVINSAVFHAGFLTGGNFFDYRAVTGDTEEDRQLIDWRKRFQAVCKRFDVQPAAACVAFGMSIPGVIATALNSSRPERVAQNVALVSDSPSNDFWLAMKDDQLIDSEFPYLGTA